MNTREDLRLALNLLWDNLSETNREKKELKAAHRLIYDVIKAHFDAESSGGMSNETLGIIIGGLNGQKNILEKMLKMLGSVGAEGTKELSPSLPEDDEPEDVPPVAPMGSSQEMFGLLMKEFSPDLFSVYMLDGMIRVDADMDEGSENGNLLEKIIGDFNASVSLVFKGE